MKIGVPTEIKNHEYRVGLTPSSVLELTRRGHEVICQSKAGIGIGLDDGKFVAAGARIVPDAATVFAEADMIVKVKEPLAEERARLRPGQILFTYLHLAADGELTRELMESGATCIAYETVTAPGGGLPLLAPMSEVAGRMAIQAAAACLEKSRQGSGMLLGGAVGVEPAKVVVIGGGIVGSSAIDMALGLGAHVTVLDVSMSVLRSLHARFGHRLSTVYSTQDKMRSLIRDADVVIGGVLIPGAAAPKLVTYEDVSAMRPGSVLVDVAIDQGGCAETSRPTTHQDPTFVVEEVVHYCVANMPGAVARTSTYALNNATLPFVVALAEKGLQALHDDPHLGDGLSIHAGQLTHEGVGHDLSIPHISTAAALAAAA
jgi:alanine dehydrogenase